MRSTFAIFLLLAILSCDNDDQTPIPKIESLRLYWDHEIFTEEGRSLRFEFTSTNQFDNDYKLVFSELREDNFIKAKLIQSIDEGKCQYFPWPTPANTDYDPTKCFASGGFHLPDKTLPNGIYTLKIITPFFEIESELSVTDEVVTLNIPANDYLESSIKEVYPMPKGLLSGAIVYQGSENAADANGFLTYLENLGLIETTVPNHPYRNLMVDDNGHPLSSDWEPDRHLIGFLFKLNNVDVRTIFDESRKYFDQKDLDISLYTSNGDQANFSKSEGVTVVYAPK